MDTNELKVPSIIRREPCAKHDAELHIPCWYIYPTTGGGGYLLGICNHRARKAGMVGTISPPATASKPGPPRKQRGQHGKR